MKNTSTAGASFVRMAGILCLVGGVIAAVGATITATIDSSVPATELSYPYTPAVFRVTEVVWTVAHVLMFVGALGLARSGLAGASMPARIGLWISPVGMALIVPFELGFAFFATAAVESTPSIVLGTGIGLATMVAALGFTLAGIAALRTGLWRGWGRFTPLLCGLFVFFVFLPIQIIQPTAFLWPVAGWSACFILLGIALLHHASTPVPSELDSKP